MGTLTYIQNQVAHPGEFLKEEIEVRGWLQRDLAFILGIQEQAMNPIIAGKRGISSEMAKALAAAFDVPAEFFINLQKAYDLSKTAEPDPSIKRRARLQDKYPVREMIKRGWIENTDAAMLEEQMQRFFEVKSIDNIPHLKHAAKKTEPEKTPPEQLVWLYRVRQMAKSMVVEKYTEKKLKNAIRLLKELRLEPEGVRHVPRILAESGVRFVIVETLPKAKIDGVCFWLGNAPVIGVSIRLDKIDNFWFVLGHEIEHVLQKHGRINPVVDTELEGEHAGVGELISEEEKVANMAGADFCVPKEEFESFFIRKHHFSERDVLGFASRLKVHPGLVVGQLHNRTQKHYLFRKYIVKVRQLILPSAMVDGWGEVAPVYL